MLTISNHRRGRLRPSAILAHRSRWRTAAAGVAIAAIAIGPGIGAAAWWQAPGDQSPATGDAEVVAHGVAPLSDGELSWRVVRGSAGPPANAEVVQAALGFLLADSGALLVEEGSGEQTRLAAGEAMLTRAGGEEVRAALGPTAATYYTIEIVAGGAGNAAGEVLFAGDPFPGPNANHDLDLVRDVLDGGETLDIPAGAGPALFLVTAGGADVAGADGSAASLAAGRAAEIAGAATVTAGSDGATIAVAYVGPAVPRLRAAAPAASPVPDVTATSETVAAPASPTPRAVETPVAEATAVETEVVSEATPSLAAGAADEDGDGLTADQEAKLNTDPSLADTDADGLNDGEEVNAYETEPLAPDTDNDGIRDGDEIAQGSNPLDPNSPPPVPAATSEPAADAAPPAEAGPTDSDGDGLPDDVEATVGTDPYDIDTDADDATDGDEYYTFQTGPLNPDTDGDGVLDGAEIVRGTNPNDPNSK